MRRFAAPLLCLAFASLLPSSVQAVGDASDLPYTKYRGELLDGSLRPITGVFLLRFKLTPLTPSNNTVLWEDTVPVGVTDGVYDLRLGANRPLNPSMFRGSYQLIVSTMGGTELTRHTILLTPMTQKTDPDVFRLPDPVVLAQTARRAIVAAHADEAANCTHLDGRSLEQVDRYEELLNEIVRLETQLASRSGRPKVSTRQVGLPRIGGPTGNRYERACPPGYVMTGGTIHAGDLVDSFTATCTQLK